MSAPRTSVIMPTYNKARYLDLSLASWRHQRDRDYEIVLVDDGSTDETPAVLDRYRTSLPLVTTRIENSGRAAARNRALALARGRNLVFCDDDRVVHPAFVEAHSAALARHGGDVVALGWQLGLLSELRPGEDALPVLLALRLARRFPELEPTLAARRTFVTATPADFDQDLAILDLLQLPEPWFVDHVQPVIDRFGEDITGCELAWVFGTTGNMAITRDQLERVGGFDERFTGWGIEDTELHLRMVRAGCRTVVARDAVNYHQNHPRDHKRLMVHWARNAQYLFAKHTSLDVAMYLHTTLTGRKAIEAHDLVREARALGDSPLAVAHRQLTLSAIRQVIDNTQCNALD